MKKKQQMFLCSSYLHIFLQYVVIGTKMNYDLYLLATKHISLNDLSDYKENES